MGIRLLTWVAVALIGIGFVSGDEAKRNTCQLSGVCTDHTGQPVPDAAATLYHSDDQMSEVVIVERVTADSQGAFRFKPFEISADQYGRTRHLITVTAENHGSFAKRIIQEAASAQRIDAILHGQPATLIGYVTGPDGKPVAGARAFLPNGFHQEPVHGVRSATTDQKGVFRISDMAPWRPPLPGQRRMNLLIDHPDFAKTMTTFESVPQILRIQLDEPAVVTGRVVDAVANQPAAHLIVSAQGVADSGWFQTRTDADGNYELRMTPDRYNIWAEMDDRIAIAVNNVKAIAGKTVQKADINMTQGAIVYGNVIGVGDGEQSAAGLRVGHYGAARPRSGAAVTSTPVNQDGTYRIRVAPGKNYLYLMGGGGSIEVQVKDGEELEMHIVPGVRVDITSDPSKKLRAIALAERRLREATEELAAKRDRGDTQVAKLLDQLEVYNQREFVYQEAWLQTLHDLVSFGRDAVPELIAELDATEDNMMFRCMGFVLRAIDDRRAVPALIRSIPRIYLTHGSDMGLQSDNDRLVAFAQKHDLLPQDMANRYRFGRPIREIFGALHSLTDQDFDDSQIYRIRPTGTETQRELKRELVERHAEKWADWWHANATELDVPEAFHDVDLPAVKAAKIVPVQLGIDYQSCASQSNAMLEAVQATKPSKTFLDLDTGREGTLPKQWRDVPVKNLPMDAVETWARSEGYDLMGTEYSIDGGKQCFGIRLLGCRALQLPEDHWKKDFHRVRLEDLIELGQPIGEYLFRNDEGVIDHLGHATFLLVTAEETPVIFYLGIEVQDDSLKPGGFANGDNELNPIAFRKGRRYAMKLFEPVDE